MNLQVKLRAEYDDSKLIRLKKIDENIIDLPLFSILYIDVRTLSGKINPEEPIMMIPDLFVDFISAHQDYSHYKHCIDDNPPS